MHRAGNIGLQPSFSEAVRQISSTSHWSAFLDEMYTVAPFVTKLCAIIKPIPREPPVIKATLPSNENRSLIRTLIYLFGYTAYGLATD